MKMYGIYSVPRPLRGNCEPVEDFAVEVGQHLLQMCVARRESDDGSEVSWFLVLNHRLTRNVEEGLGTIWRSPSFPHRRDAQALCRQIYEVIEVWLTSYHLTERDLDVRVLERRL